MRLMSPERPPSHDGGPMLESPNLMLSTMPIESSHVILQQNHQNNIQYGNQGNQNINQQQQQQQPQPLQQQQQQQQQHAIVNGNNVQNNGQVATISIAAASPTTTASSKFLVLQHNSVTDNYIATNENNGVGNIVLLATEQMEINPAEHNGVNGGGGGSGADEELTSLTWLHDKNLLKGINLSCAKVRSSPESTTQQNSGAISPTSDFLEDSCVSEDNTSSVLSNSDQSIGIYSTETSPKNYHSIQNVHNNNNNSINKNRNHIITSGTTTSIHVSPGGTTVIEYHTSNNKQSPYANGGNNLMMSSPSSMSSSSSSSSSSLSSTMTNTSTPHQHFHKKYLREEHVKTLKSTCTTTTSTAATATATIEQITVESPMTTPTKQQFIKYEDASDYSSPGKSHNNEISGNGNDIYNSPNAKSNGSSSSSSNSKSSGPKTKHPNNLPYDPMVHTNNKPPFSFSSLIFMAIEDAPERALPVKEIYAWIVKHFPYFKTAPTGWKNSVRHNLSLNKCFQKVEKAPNMGKGSLWRVEQQYRQNLIQALTRSNFHPFSTLAKTAYKNSQRSSDNSTSGSKSGAGRPVNAELFPHLSKYMAEIMNSNMDPPSPSANSIEDEYRNLTSYSYYVNGSSALNNNINNNNTIVFNGSASSSPEKLARDWGADSIEDVNAATAMLALKHGPKVFTENFQNGRPVITSSPSEDHTYSAGGGNGGNGSRSNSNSDNNSNGTSSDAAYESSEESQTPQYTAEDLEEQRRKAEGVDALLNLAGVSMTSPIILKRAQPSDSHTYMENIPIPYNHQHHNHLNNSSVSANSEMNHLSSPPPLKKSKTRTLRTKLKKKVWLR